MLMFECSAFNNVSRHAENILLRLSLGFDSWPRVSGGRDFHCEHVHFPILDDTHTIDLSTVRHAARTESWL